MLDKAMMRVWFDTQSIIIVSSCVLKEEELVSSENSASIFNTLSDLPSQLEDGAAVLGEAVRLAGSLSQDNLDAHRHKHLAYILAEQAQLNSNNSHSLHTNLNKVRSSLTSICDAHSLTHPNDKIQRLTHCYVPLCRWSADRACTGNQHWARCSGARTRWRQWRPKILNRQSWWQRWEKPSVAPRSTFTAWTLATAAL